MAGMMGPWVLGGALCALLGLGQAEQDCERPARARSFMDRLMLADLEYAEDVHREAFWAALGRCPAEPAGQACRAREARRFDARWEEERARIEAKYRRMREDFEARCRASIS
jgi:hypothetical protein